MIELGFAGWFQCRLATDPDPWDEPRGVSGSTFAYPGEPDLDGIIRFGSTPFARVPGPPVGVTVRDVRGPGAQAARGLRGAPVELLREPRFDGRNGLLGEPGRELIHPLHVRIARAGAVVERYDPLDALDAAPAQASHAARRRRSGRGVEFDTRAVGEVAQATGITDFEGHRAARRRALEAALERATDPLRAAALRRRRSGLIAIELVRVRYRLRLGEHGGRGVVSPDLGPLIDVEAPWPLDLWLGAWDPDALCGYCAGVVGLPAPGEPA